MKQATLVFLVTFFSIQFDYKFHGAVANTV